MAMAFRATAVISPPPHSKSKSKPKPKPNSHQQKLPLPSTTNHPHHHQQLLISSITTPTAISLLALFSTPNPFCEARALSKEDIVSSLTKVEDTIDQVQDVGSKVLDISQQVFRVLSEALKPAVDVALPVLRGAGDEALKIASPVVSDAANQAKVALQSAGIDPSPVLSAAKAFPYSQYL